MEATVARIQARPSRRKIPYDRDQLLLRLHPTLKQKLRRAAFESGESMTEIAIEAIEEKLARAGA